MIQTPQYKTPSGPMWAAIVLAIYALFYGFLLAIAAADGLMEPWQTIGLYALALTPFLAIWSLWRGQGALVMIGVMACPTLYWGYLWAGVFLEPYWDLGAILGATLIAGVPALLSAILLFTFLRKARQH